MTQPLYSDHDSAQAVLSILDYLSDLFTGTPKESFSRDELLTILNCIRSNSALIDPDVVLAYQIAAAELEQETTN